MDGSYSAVLFDNPETIDIQDFANKSQDNTATTADDKPVFPSMMIEPKLEPMSNIDEITPNGPDMWSQEGKTPPNDDPSLNSQISMSQGDNHEESLTLPSSSSSVDPSNHSNNLSTNTPTEPDQQNLDLQRRRLLSQRKTIVQCPWPDCHKSLGLAALKRHIDMTHRLIRYECLTCKQLFKRKDYLQQHYMTKACGLEKDKLYRQIVLSDNMEDRSTTTGKRASESLLNDSTIQSADTQSDSLLNDESSLSQSTSNQPSTLQASINSQGLPTQVQIDGHKPTPKKARKGSLLSALQALPIGSRTRNLGRDDSSTLIDMLQTNPAISLYNPQMYRPRSTADSNSNQPSAVGNNIQSKGSMTMSGSKLPVVSPTFSQDRSLASTAPRGVAVNDLDNAMVSSERKEAETQTDHFIESVLVLRGQPSNIRAFRQKVLTEAVKLGIEIVFAA